MPAQSEAQGFPTSEASIGYAVVKDPDLAGKRNVGFAFSFARNVDQWFGIAGEFGYNFWLIEVPGTRGGHTLLKFGTLLGGLRVPARRLPRVAPFAQALVGVGVASETAFGESDTTFVIQPGAGVDIGRTSLALRLQGDYRLFTKNRENANQFRFGVSVVFRPG